MKDINIAQSILSKRREKGLTQDELANYIGVSKASVSKWETGQSYPDITLLPWLATFFNMSIDELMGYTPQMAKGDIRALYKRLSTDFAEKPFDEVMADARMNIKTYYSCYPLLLQMVVLILNHYQLAETSEAQASLLEEATALCERIRTESTDILLAQQANSMEAVLYLMRQQPAEVIDLLNEVALHPFSQNEIILASAFEMKGDHEAAKRALQITGYQCVLYLLGSAVMLLSLYKNNRDRFEEILRRSLVMVDAFHLKMLHPNTFIQLASTAAFCLVELGDYERALHFLRESVEAFKNFTFPIMLQGDDYFDLLGDWFADFDLGNNSPRDEKLIKKSFIALLTSPALTPLFELPEYKSIVADAERL